MWEFLWKRFCNMTSFCKFGIKFQSKFGILFLICSEILAKFWHHLQKVWQFFEIIFWENLTCDKADCIYKCRLIKMLFMTSGNPFVHDCHKQFKTDWKATSIIMIWSDWLCWPRGTCHKVFFLNQGPNNYKVHFRMFLANVSNFRTLIVMVFVCEFDGSIDTVGK